MAGKRATGQGKAEVGIRGWGPATNVSIGKKNGGVQFGLAFDFRGGNMHFLRTSVRYLGRIGS